MCYLTNKSPEHEVAGYKVLAKRGGKYFSSFTGLPFSTGQVKIFLYLANRLTNFWNQDLDTKYLYELPFFNSRFSGKTSAFKYIKSATDLIRFIGQFELKTENKYKFVIVKIVFKGEIWEGNYNAEPIWACNNVVSFKELEDEKKLTKSNQPQKSLGSF